LETDVMIKEMVDQAVLGVRFKTTMATIGQEIGMRYGEIFQHMGRIGVAPAGPPIALYYDVETKQESIDMEVCVPVAQETSGEGELLGYILRGGKAATLVYRGAYDDIGAAYETLSAYVEEKRLATAGPVREIYMTDPGQVSDPSENVTEVVFPIE